jgi:hypothetical protein
MIFANKMETVQIQIEEKGENWILYINKTVNEFKRELQNYKDDILMGNCKKFRIMDFIEYLRKNGYDVMFMQ